MSLLATADGIEALVAGASSGIGLALVEQLLQSGFAGSPIVRVHALARSVNRSPALSSLQDRVGPRLRRWAVDLADPTAIDRFGRALHSEGARSNLICHAAAVLHDGDMQPERSVVQLDPAHLQRALMVNAVAPVLMARALWPLLRGRGPLLLTALSARVGSIGDNRLGGWYAYRASKAALNQLYRTLSIELARVNPQALLSAAASGNRGHAVVQTVPGWRETQSAVCSGKGCRPVAEAPAGRGYAGQRAFPGLGRQRRALVDPERALGC
ncbi:MAG: SDR family NAD(P)-dependent oxidoreductase [Lysobacterales bacterium]